MEIVKIENLNFSYPNGKKVLKNINLNIDHGEFVTICGKSGCGKTTLVRHLKSVLTPSGNKSGNIFFDGIKLDEFDDKIQSEKIGYVFQNPDTQTVTDKVWHELAFGLESLGVKSDEIRRKVAEISSFFGINEWFYKDVDKLSGGQKQILALASVMITSPDLIVLDEPTSFLDPISSYEFLSTLKRINNETGTTVILTEHRLCDAIPLSDRVIVMDNGEIIADEEPKKIGKKLKDLKSPLLYSMPAPIRVCANVCDSQNTPVTVSEGKNWLLNYKKSNSLLKTEKTDEKNKPQKPVIELKNIYFKYKKDLPDVTDDLSFKIYGGEVCAIVGGNGSGKTTALSVMGNILKPYSGKIIKNENIKTVLLPQQPELLFTKNTVREEILSLENKEYIPLFEIKDLLDMHPFDLSGGEKQRLALLLILSQNSDVYFLDEPTKGLDADFKKRLAVILRKMKKEGKGIVLVSHDIEFCAEYTDRCAMFFDGKIVSENTPREFFSNNNFYTTNARRMSVSVIENAVTTDDILYACTGKHETIPSLDLNYKEIQIPEKSEKQNTSEAKKKRSIKKSIIGIFIFILFVITEFLFYKKWDDWKNLVFEGVTILFVFVSLCLLFQSNAKKDYDENKPLKINKSSIFLPVVTVIITALTVLSGIYIFDNKKYYFISMLLITETFALFFLSYERKKPKSRELVVIGILCAITVSGRLAFNMLPQFKPFAALVILTGVCLGCEAGFLVGSLSAFLSNMYFGQGVWTPWQMFAFGIIGLVSGLLYRTGILKKSRLPLCIYGFLCVIIIYGGIMNPYTVITFYDHPTLEMILSSYVLGFPFDLIHAFSTFFFLWFISDIMIEKLERIKTKYSIFK